MLVSSPVGATPLDLNGATENHTNLLGYETVENGTLNLTPAASFDYSGVLQDGAGTLAFNKFGLTDLTLSGLNTFSGETHIIAGTLFAGLDNTLSANSRLRVNSVLELQGFDQTVLGFYGSGIIRNQANGAVTLTTANAASIVSSFSGTIIETFGNAIKLVKTGTGTQNLIGINTYSGGTDIAAGTLAYGKATSLGSGVVTFIGGGTLSSITTGTVLANDIVLTSNGRFAGNASTLTGLISGSGALIKAGGPLTISNSGNTYSGGTQLFGNNLVLGGDNVLGTGTLTFVTGSKLGTTGIGALLSNAIQLDAQMFIDEPIGQTLELAGVISGSKGMYIAGGPGTLLLSGANDFGGTTYLTTGTLGVGTSTALGSSLLYVSANVTLKAYNPVALTTKIRITDSVLTVDTGAYAMTLSGTIRNVSGTETGALVKTGSGTLTLSGNNDYSDGTTLKEGTLSVNANNRLGSIAGGLVFDGGNLRVTGLGFTTTSRAISLLSSGGIEVQNALNNFMLTQVITGVGSLNKLGNGTLTLNAANLFTGGVILTDGALVVNDNAALGTGALTLTGGTLAAGTDGLDLSNDITLGAGAIDTNNKMLTLSGDISGSGVLTKLSGGVLALTGTNSYTGGSLITDGTVYIGADNALGFGTAVFDASTNLTASIDATLGYGLTMAGAMVIDDGGHVLTLDGAIDGAGSIDKMGVGTVALNGNNSFTGGFNLDGGTVIVGSSTALGAASGLVTMAGGTVLKAGQTVALANAIDLAGAATIDTNAKTLALNGTISGAGPLTKVGLGALFLGVANSYTGGTFINQGGIEFQDGGAFGTDAIIMANGTSLSSDGSNVLANDIEIFGTAHFNNNGAMLTLDGVISGGGLAEFRGGTIALNANTYTGGTQAHDVMLQVNSDDAFGSGAVSLLASAGLQNVSGSARSLDNLFSLDAANVTIGGSDDLALTNTVSGAFGFTKTDANTLTLGIANTYLGDTVLHQGRIVVDNNGALGGGKLLVDTGTLQFGTVVKSLTLGNAIDLAGILTLDFVTPGALVDFTGGIYTASGSTVILNGLISGGGGLAFANSGDLTLAHANTYTGGTSIEDSVVRILDDHALGLGTITAGSLAGLRNDSVTAHTLANAMSLDNNGITIGGSGALTLSGDISGNFGFDKVGTDTLTLSGTNTHLGQITVGQGGLNIAGSNAADILVGSGATLSGTGSTTGNVIIANGGILSPGNSPGVISFGSLVLNNTSITNFQLAAPNGLSDRIDVAGDLTLDGVINFAALPGFTHGTYHLFAYGGQFTDNTASFGTIPVGYAFGISALDLSTTGEVNLILNAGGVLYWDGSGPHGNGIVDGGDGIWNIANSNWTDVVGNGTTGWANTTGIFAGAAGTVAVAGTLGFDMLYFQTGGYVLSDAGGELTPNGTGEIKVDPLATVTIDATITGANGLIKTGDGTLILGGANTFLGGVDVSQGILTIANSDALGSGVFTVGDQTLVHLDKTITNLVTLEGAGGTGPTFDTGSVGVELTNTISGTGSLTKIGTSELLLKSANVYAGGTVVNGGTVRVTKANGFGSGAIALADGTSIGSGASGLTIINDIAVTGSAAILTGGNTLTLSGVVSGGKLVKDEAGTLILSGPNTYLGGTSLVAGTLSIGADDKLGDAAGAVSFDGVGGATLKFTDSFDTSRDLILNGMATVDTGVYSVGLIGAITGPAGLTKTGTGGLSLTRSNTYAGGTTINEGTVIVSDAANLGTGPVQFGITGANTGTLQIVGVDFNSENTVNLAQAGRIDVTLGNAGALKGLLTGSGMLTKVGSGILTLSGDGSGFTGGITVADGTLSLGSSNAAGVVKITTTGSIIDYASGVSIANPIDINSNSTQLQVLTGLATQSGIIAQLGGARPLEKIGAGTLVLSGANTFTGLFTVADGTVGIGNTDALGKGLVALASPATLQARGNFNVGNGISLAGNSQIDSNGSQLTLSGILTGAALNKTGTGALVLSGHNLYTGGTFLNAGDISVGADENLGAATGVVTFQSATASNLVATGGFTAGRDLVVTNANTSIAINSGFAVIWDGVVSGSGSLIKAGAGKLTLTKTNSQAETVIADGILAISDDASLGLGSLTFSGAGGGILAVDTSLAIGRQIVLTADGSIDTNGSNVDLGALVTGSGSLTKLGSGVLTVALTNDYAGGTFLNKGTLVVGHSGALGTGTLTFSDLAVLQAASIVTLTNAVTTAGTDTVDTVGAATVLTLSGNIGGLGDLEKKGSGTLTLGGINTYKDTLLTAGTLAVTDGDSLGTGSLIFTGGATLQAAAANIHLGDAITTVGTDIIDTKAFYLYLDGVISGTGNLNKIGAGSLILSKANTYVNTILDGGAIIVENAGALGSGLLTMNGNTALIASNANALTITNGLQLNGTATIDTGSAGLVLSGEILGTGTLTKTSSPKLTLNGATNAYSGGTFIKAGALQLGASKAAGTGAITFGGAVPTTLQFGISGLNIGNAIALNGTTTVDLSNVTTALSGIISGNALNAVGPGTLQLGNILNTYAGTNISAGARVETTFNEALGAAAGAVSFLGLGGTLALDGALTSGRAINLIASGNIDTMTGDDELSGIVSGSGLLVKSGASQLTLSGINTYTTGTLVLGGSIKVTNDKSLGAGGLTTHAGTTVVVGGPGLDIGNGINLVGGTTLDLAGNSLTLSGIIGGAGPLSVQDGTLYLAVTNLHSGGTNVLNAVVVANNAQSFGSGSINLKGAGTLLASVPLILENAVSLTGSSNQIGSSGSLTLKGVISGSGGFTKDGAGTLNLLGTSTYAGDTSVNFGGLAVNGALTGAGTVTIASGATLSGAGTIAGNVVIADGAHFAPGNSPGTITVGGLALSSGSFLDYDLGQANVAGGTFNDLIIVTHDLTLDGHLKVTNSGTFGVGVYNLISYGGVLTGPGLMVDSVPATFVGLVQTLVPGQVNLIVTNSDALVQYWDGGDMLGNGSIGGGAGTWSANNTNWTTPAPSTLNASWQSGVASFGGTTAGTVLIDGTQTIQGLQFTTTGYTLAAGAGGSLNIAVQSFVSTGAGIAAVIEAPINGVGSLDKQGVGTLTLTGLNNYTGGTTLTQGTLGIGGVSALGTGTLTISGGATLQATTAASLTNAITIAGIATVDAQATMSLSGPISGSGSLTKTGSSLLELYGNNSYTGGTTIAAGALFINNAHAVGTGVVKMENNTTLAAIGSDFALGNSIVLNGDANVNRGGRVFTLDGIVSGVGSLTAIGTGTLVFNGLNTFAGGLNLNGATVSLGTDKAAGSGAITFLDASTLGARISGLVIANTIDLGALGGTIDSGSGNFKLDGIISGTHLTKSGGGELILTAANTYTGGTALTDGTLTVVNDKALGTGALTFTSGKTLKAGGGIALDNDIVTVGTDTIDSGIYTLTLNGAVSGSGTINKTGINTLVLAHSNTYTGGTTLSEGTIIVKNSSAALGSGALSMANDTILRAGTNNLALDNAITLTGLDTVDTANFALTLNGIIDGSGTLQKAGNGGLFLNGDNTYTGGTLLSSSDLIIGHKNALGTGQLAMSGFAVLRAGIDGLKVANNITTNNVSSLDAQGFTFTLDGMIDGSGQINTGGNGTVVLNGANTYTGGTVHATGTLVVGNDAALGTGLAILSSNSTLAAGAAGLTLANQLMLNQGSVGQVVAIDTRATTFTLTGQLTGTGTVGKSGLGNLVLNNANNNYTGGTNLTQGTITIGADSALGTGALAMTGGTTLQAGITGLVVANDIVTAGLGTIATQAYDLTLDGAITGAGGITKTGTGTLTLGGTSTYTGATALTEGKTLVDGSLGLTAVTVASGATLGGHGLIAGSVDIADGGILAAGNSPGTLTFGSLTLHNASLVNFDLGAANTIGGVHNDLNVVLGDLTLDGKLTVADSLAFGTGMYELFSYGGTLTDHGLDIVSLAGGGVGVVETLVHGQVNLLVTAPGDLIQYWDAADGIGNGVISGGTGTWSTFATNWTGAAPSAINGSWQGGIARFQGTAGAVTLDTTESFRGLIFDIDGYSVGATGSGGLVADGSTYIFVDNSATTNISASIGGSGSIRKQGSGTLNLSGANTYTGGTDLQFGTLGVGSNTALGTGGLTIQHATTLAATVTGLTLANAITTVGSGDIDSGAGIFTLAGNIDGAGSIEKIGAGNLVLNGANSFTNLAALSGTVTLGTNTAAGIGSINLIGGTTLAAGVAGLVVANATTVGGGAVAIDSTKGIFTLSGPVTGSGSLVSTGTLVLNGANSFNGLAIAAGSVTIGTRLAAGVTGLVVANAITTAGVGQLDSGAGLLTLNGIISGAGSIAKVGTGTLRLNGTNSFASAAINAGTLAVGSAGALGTGGLTINSGTTLQSAVTGLTFANAVTLVGTTTVDTQAFALSLSGIVGGSGSLSKTGTGTLTLSAANTYTGGTGLAAGTLAVSNAAALGTGALTITAGMLQAGITGLTLANAIVATGAGTVDTQAFALTLSGATSGAAALTKTGTGTLFLTGASTRTGSTTITAGTLNSAVAGLGSGNIVDNGALVFNQATDAAYGPVISGTGTVTKVGAGNLTLTGTSTVSGATSLTGGRLTVNGALSASTVTAATGTTLAGTGSIAGLVATAGSTVSPGDPDLAVGTLTVTGNAAFQAGSTLLVNILPTSADRLNVGGTANIAGNLALTATTGQYFFNTSYTLFSSAGARTGTFVAPSLTLFGPAFAPTLTYGANDLVLKLVPNSLVLLLGAGPNSANVLARATAFDRATTAGFNPQAFYNLYLQGAGLGAAINQLSGEIHSADSRQALTDTRHVREAALDRLGAGLGSNGGNDASSKASGENGLAGWGRAVGSWGNTDSDGNGAKLDIDTKGVLVGIDITSDTWKAGALFNALESKVDTRILGTSKVKTTGGGIYGGYRSAAGFSLAVGASVGDVKTHSSRAITVPGLTQVLTGHTSGTNYQVFGDIAYDLAAAEKTRVEPFVRFAYVAYHVDGLSESGGFAGLVSGKQKYDATFTTLGLRASTELGKSASLRGSLGYQYTGGDRSPIASLSIQGTNQNAGIRSVALDKSAFAGEAGVDFRIGKNSSLGVGYTGVIGKNNSDNGVKATLSVGF